jgi:hypothetical protein
LYSCAYPITSPSELSPSRLAQDLIAINRNALLLAETRPENLTYN